MFLGHNSILKGLATIFVVFGLASTLVIAKTKQTKKNGKAKHYNVEGSRWTNRTLSYRILNYPGSLSQADCDSEIKLAFDLWSQHANLTFTQIRTTEPVNIEINFVHGEHGDGRPLQGTSLSHAYPPRYGGDIHFDSSRKWTTNWKTGFKLSMVAAYDIGLSLGLKSSRRLSSIMYPHFRHRRPLQLSAYDIEVIQYVYGKKTIDSEHIARIES